VTIAPTVTLALPLPIRLAVTIMPRHGHVLPLHYQLLLRRKSFPHCLLRNSLFGCALCIHPHAY